MVQRTEGTSKLDEFSAKVVSIELVESTMGRQYKFELAPVGFEVGGKTGKLWEWVPLSKTATEDTVPQGSVMDRYLQQVEIVESSAKKEKTVDGALKTLLNKTYKFKKVKLGKDYDGHPAREYSIPVQAI